MFKIRTCALNISFPRELFLVAIATALFVTATAAQTTISGCTYRWQEAIKSDKANSVHYDSLPHVKITVVRFKSVIATAESKEDGSFELVVESGAPINVIFYLSNEDVPQMQSLSAAPEDKHNVSAALITTNQHRELEQTYHMVSVESIVHCILESVPEKSGVAEVLRAIK